MRNYQILCINNMHACSLSLSHAGAYKKQFTRSQSMNSSSFIMTNLFRHPNSNTCLRCTDDTWTFSAQIFQTFTAGFLQNTRHSTPFETYQLQGFIFKSNIQHTKMSLLEASASVLLHWCFQKYQQDDKCEMTSRHHHENYCE